MSWTGDLSFAARTLRRSPGYTAVAALTLALGVAATTTMFSVVEGVLLRPLALAAPDRLMDVAETMAPKRLQGAVSVPDLADLRQQSRAFATLGGYTTWPGFSLSAGDRPERLPGVRVAPELLATLGVRPLYGRLLLPEEATAGRDQVVVLGEALWRRRFATDPATVGTKVEVNGEARTVVGVVPGWLHFPPEAEISQLYVPLVATPQQASSRGNHWLRVAGRLAPGVSPAAAQAEMDGIALRLSRQYPDTNEGRGFRLTPLRSRLTAAVRQPISILFGAVTLLLAIACLNVVNLLLAGGIARWRETAVRRALGAGRWHLARRCLAEGLLLALLGALAALPLIWGGLRLLLALAPADLPRLGDIALDGRALAFSLAVACATGILFSLAPTWQAGKLGGGELLRSGMRTTAGAGSHRLRRLLVVVEMALSLLLLVGAGLLLRSLWNLTRVDPGFRTESVLSADVALPAARYTRPEQVGAFYRRLLARVGALPGVRASGMISLLPLRDWGWNADLVIAGAPPQPPSSDTWIETRTVSPGYFAAMGIGLTRGRLLGESDEAAAPPVVVINEAAVRHFWHGADPPDPLGARVTIGGDAMRVVGVVRDVHNAGVARPPLPEAYFPYAQQGALNMTLVVRTASGDPLALAPALRRAVQAEDRGLPLDKVTALTGVVAGSIGPRRFQAVLLATFAGLALVLAAVGLYGLLAYSVVQRRQEIGVRLALGAGAAGIWRLILGDGLRLVLPGLAAGLAGAVALRHLLATLVFGIEPLDVPTLAGVCLALTAVAVLACVVPAERAVRIEPLEALREE
jgi:putative ABC transport system permease protein